MRQANSTSWNQCLKWRGSKGIVILKLMFFSSFEPWPYVSNIFPYAPTCFPYFPTCFPWFLIFFYFSSCFSMFFPIFFQMFPCVPILCPKSMPCFPADSRQQPPRDPLRPQPRRGAGDLCGLPAAGTSVARSRNGPGEPWGIHPQISWCFFRPSCDSPVWKKVTFSFSRSINYN